MCVCRLDDLAVDSDEEVDYSKMDQVATDRNISAVQTQNLQTRADAVAVRSGRSRWRCCRFLMLAFMLSCRLFQGNKKGPLGRWDFDTQEEYSDYMNNKEALPK